MRAFVALAVTMLAGSATAESLYSTLVAEECLTFTQDQLGASQVCPGPVGYNLVVHDYDARVFFEVYGPNWGENVRLEVSPIEPGFTHVAGEKAEWIFEDGEIAALILRLGVQDGSGETDPNLVTTRLLVARLDTADAAKGCWVAVVAGSSSADVEVRAAAAEARTLPCLGG